MSRRNLLSPRQGSRQLPWPTSIRSALVICKSPIPWLECGREDGVEEVSRFRKRSFRARLLGPDLILENERAAVDVSDRMDRLERDRRLEGMRRRTGGLSVGTAGAVIWTGVCGLEAVSAIDPNPDPYEEGPGVGDNPGDGQPACPYPNSVGENSNGGRLGGSSRALPFPMLFVTWASSSNGRSPKPSWVGMERDAMLASAWSYDVEGGGEVEVRKGVCVSILVREKRELDGYISKTS
jgi:hypothetical protein